MRLESKEKRKSRKLWKESRTVDRHFLFKYHSHFQQLVETLQTTNGFLGETLIITIGPRGVPYAPETNTAKTKSKGRDKVIAYFYTGDNLSLFSQITTYYLFSIIISIKNVIKSYFYEGRG